MTANGPATMSVAEARDLAERAHAGQRDRDGSLHIDHVGRVAEGVAEAEAEQRVAWLHDVLEDTDVDPAELRGRLREPEFEAVVLLTHDETEPYAEYIDRLVAAEGEAGRLARAVKEADMLDNLRRCAIARDPAVGSTAPRSRSSGRSPPATDHPTVVHRPR